VALRYRVFLHSYLGFMSTSTLLYGERDAISHRRVAVAERLPQDDRRAHSYAEEPHARLRFALPPRSLLQPGRAAGRIPGGSTGGAPERRPRHRFQLRATGRHVSIDRFGPDTPSTVVIPLPLAEPRLELEGEEVLFSDDWRGQRQQHRCLVPPCACSAPPTSPLRTGTCGSSKAGSSGG